MGNNGGLPAFRPPHPGEYLREDVLPSLGMTIKDFAARLGVSRNTVSNLVNERRSLSTDMAVRLGQALGNGARFWLALQMQHDVWEAENAAPVVQPINWPHAA